MSGLSAAIALVSLSASLWGPPVVAAERTSDGVRAARASEVRLLASRWSVAASVRGVEYRGVVGEGFGAWEVARAGDLHEGEAEDDQLSVPSSAAGRIEASAGEEGASASPSSESQIKTSTRCLEVAAEDGGFWASQLRRLEETAEGAQQSASEEPGGPAHLIEVLRGVLEDVMERIGTLSACEAARRRVLDGGEGQRDAHARRTRDRRMSPEERRLRSSRARAGGRRSSMRQGAAETAQGRRASGDSASGGAPPQVSFHAPEALLEVRQRAPPRGPTRRLPRREPVPVFHVGDRLRAHFELLGGEKSRGTRFCTLLAPMDTEATVRSLIPVPNL